MSDIIENLERMASFLESKWRDSDDAALDAQLVSAYVAACAELRAQRPFIQLDNHIIRKTDIIRAEVSVTTVTVYTRQLETDDPQICSVAYSKRLIWNSGSPQGKALLEWLQGQSEILVPYEPLVETQEEEDPNPFTASTAESMKAEAEDNESIDFPY